MSFNLSQTLGLATERQIMMIISKRGQRAKVTGLRHSWSQTGVTQHRPDVSEEETRLHFLA